MSYIPRDPNESGTTEQVKPPPPIWLFQVLVKKRRIFHLCFWHVSDQGSNPGSLCWQYVVLAAGHQGSSLLPPLTSVNPVALNVVYGYPVDSLLSVPLGVCPETELLDHVVILRVIFGGSSFGTLPSIVSHLLVLASVSSSTKYEVEGKDEMRVREGRLRLRWDGWKNG